MGVIVECLREALEQAQANARRDEMLMLMLKFWVRLESRNVFEQTREGEKELAKGRGTTGREPLREVMAGAERV
jgi:hypothetical protein